MIDANATDLASYGLAPAPVLEVDVATKRRQRRRKCSSAIRRPPKAGVYAKLGGDPRLYTMANSHKATALDKTSKDLREKHLLNFTGGKLEGVEANDQRKDGPEKVVFARVGDIGLGDHQAEEAARRCAPRWTILFRSWKLTEMDP